MSKKPSKQPSKTPKEPDFNALAAIAIRAFVLDEFLRKNVGRTADWPIKIVVDNDESAKVLTAIMSSLTHQLRPHREFFENLRKQRSLTKRQVEE